MMKGVSMWPSGVCRFLAAAAVLLVAAPLAAQVALSPAPVSCVEARGNTPVILAVQPSQGLSSVRVYFRAVNEPEPFFFLEMRSQGNGTYWAVLPIPESSTREVQLYFAVVDGAGQVTTTQPLVVPVVSGCQAQLTSEQDGFARNLVVGETSEAQKDELVWGFQCPGIISRLDLRGELRPDDRCREALMLLASKKDILIPALLVGGAVGGAVYLDRKDPSPSQP